VKVSLDLIFPVLDAYGSKYAHGVSPPLSGIFF
jgi:hypothetical protein